MDMIVAIGPILAQYLDMRTRGAMLCLSKQLSPHIVEWACFQPTPLQRKKLDMIFQAIATRSSCRVYGSEMVLAVCVLYHLSTLKLKAQMYSLSYQRRRFEYTCRRLSTYHKGIVKFDAKVSWLASNPTVPWPSSNIAIGFETSHCITLAAGYEADPYTSHTRFELTMQYIPHHRADYRHWLLNEAMNLPGRIFTDFDILWHCGGTSCAKWNNAFHSLLGRVHVVPGKRHCDLHEDETHITVFLAAHTGSECMADFLAHYFTTGPQRRLKVTLVTSNVTDTIQTFCNRFLAYDGATSGYVEKVVSTTAAKHTESRIRSSQNVTLIVDSAMWAFNQQLTPRLIEVFLETPETQGDRNGSVIKLSCSFNRDPHYRAQWTLLSDPRKRWARHCSFYRDGYADGIDGQHVWGNFTYMFWLLTGNTWIDYAQNRFKAIPSLCKPLESLDFIEHLRSTRDSSPRRLRARRN